MLTILFLKDLLVTETDFWILPVTVFEKSAVTMEGWILCKTLAPGFPLLPRPPLADHLWLLPQALRSLPGGEQEMPRNMLSATAVNCLVTGVGHTQH